MSACPSHEGARPTPSTTRSRDASRWGAGRNQKNCVSQAGGKGKGSSLCQGQRDHTAALPTVGGRQVINYGDKPDQHGRVHGPVEGWNPGTSGSLFGMNMKGFKIGDVCVINVWNLGCRMLFGFKKPSNHQEESSCFHSCYGGGEEGRPSRNVLAKGRGKVG